MEKKFTVFKYESFYVIWERRMLIIFAALSGLLSVLVLIGGMQAWDFGFLFLFSIFLLSHFGIIIQSRYLNSFCLLDEDGIFVFESSSKKMIYHRWEDFKYMRYRDDGAIKGKKEVLLISVRTLSDKEATKAAKKAAFLHKYVPIDGVIAFLSCPKHDSSPKVLEAYRMINKKLGHLMGLGEDEEEDASE